MTKHILLTSMSGAYGGMEIRMIQEAEILVNNGYHVSVLLNPFDELNKFKKKLTKGIKLYVLPVPYFLEDWRFWRTKKIAAYVFYTWVKYWIKPDLVHVFMCWTSYGLTHLWGSSLQKIPNIVSVHNVFPVNPITSYRARHLSTCFANTKGIYSVSHSAKINFEAIFGNFYECQHEVIPNWVNLTKFDSDAAKGIKLKSQLNKRANELFLGCVARLSTQKNLFFLVDVFEKLLIKHTNIKLLLVGDGPLQQELEQYIKKKGLSTQCIMIGFVENPEDYFRVIDIHVLLSLREGFGISTIEAMASGCVCCVSDIPGSKDVINRDDLGVKVPLNDLTKTVETLDDLLANPDRLKSLKEEGLNEVVNYSQESIKKIIIAFYKQVDF